MKATKTSISHVNGEFCRLKLAAVGLSEGKPLAHIGSSAMGVLLTAASGCPCSLGAHPGHASGCGGVRCGAQALVAMGPGQLMAGGRYPKPSQDGFPSGPSCGGVCPGQADPFLLRLASRSQEYCGLALRTRLERCPPRVQGRRAVCTLGEAPLMCMPGAGYRHRQLDER